MIPFLTQTLTLKVAALVALASAILAKLFSLVEGIGFTGSFLSAILGALTILLPAYLLHRRENLKRLDDAKKLRDENLGETTDALLRYSQAREIRLDELTQNLRAEERSMYMKQVELSRRRAHILARGMMSMELANERLIAMLTENHVHVPFEMMGAMTRSSIIQELKELEHDQDLMIPIET